MTHRWELVSAELYTYVRGHAPPSSVLPHINTAAFGVLITWP